MLILDAMNQAVGECAENPFQNQLNDVRRGVEREVKRVVTARPEWTELLLARGTRYSFAIRIRNRRPLRRAPSCQGVQSAARRPRADGRSWGGAFAGTRLVRVVAHER